MAISPLDPKNLYREGLDPNAARYRIRDVSYRALMSNDYDTPLTKITGGLNSAREKFGFVGQPTDTEYEWIYDGALPVSLSLAANLAAPSSLGNDVDGNPVYPTQTVALNNVSYIHKGMVLQFPVPVSADPNTDGAILDNELMWVESVDYGAGTAVLKRGYANTPVYSYNGGTSARIMATAGLEDQGWVANYQTRRGSVKNYWQTFFAGYADTKVRQLFQSNYGDDGDELERQRRKILGGRVGDRDVTGFLPLQLEMAIMYGKPFRGNPVAELPSSFAGITGFPIRKPVFNTTLTYDDLMNVMQDIYTSGGDVDTIVCSPSIKKIISGWARADRSDKLASTNRSERSYGVVVDNIETDFGTIGVAMSRHMRAGEAFILDTSKLGLLTAVPWTEAILAETDTPLVERTMYYGIFGFCLQHPEHHAWIRIDSAEHRWTGDANLYTEPSAQSRVYPGVVV